MGPLRATAITGLSHDRVIEVCGGRELTSMLHERLLLVESASGPTLWVKAFLESAKPQLKSE
jgi:hypothetical protein